jgi:carbamoylphosphate synthase large subunit
VTQLSSPVSDVDESRVLLCSAERLSRVVRHLECVGGATFNMPSTPQRALCIIRVNARLSRSSALASKATGYTRLRTLQPNISSLWSRLVSIRSTVTKTTTACFECKFGLLCCQDASMGSQKIRSRVSNKLGSSMMSIGELWPSAVPLKRSSRGVLYG